MVCIDVSVSNTYIRGYRTMYCINCFTLLFGRIGLLPNLIQATVQDLVRRAIKPQGQQNPTNHAVVTFLLGAVWT